MNTIKYNNKDINLDIKISPEEKTIWMSQSDMAKLFKINQKEMSKKIQRLLETYINLGSVIAKMETTGNDGKIYKIKHYNLDIIKLIGYKIDPIFTDEFINWVNEEINKRNNQIVPIKSNFIRFNNGQVLLDVTIEPTEDTVYLDKDQLVLLFDTTRQNLEYHISNIYESGELEHTPTCKEILQVQMEGGREVSRSTLLYNLDMIISLGFRINSKRGIEFRKWANSILKSYLYKGYAVDENRIKIIETHYNYMKEEIDKIKSVVNEHNKLIYKYKEKERVFFKGEEFDAYDFFCELVSKANKNIIIKDPYVDEVLLSIIKNVKPQVKVDVITTNRCKISDEDINKYQSQYHDLKIIKVSNFHDRHILIDEDELYLLDSSFNRMGHHQTSIIRYNESSIINIIKSSLCETIK